MEACTIISLSKKLEYAFPQTQFLWHPSTNGTNYTSNFEWSGVHDDELINQIRQHHDGAELIQLTLHDNFVYYK